MLAVSLALVTIATALVAFIWRRTSRVADGTAHVEAAAIRQNILVSEHEAYLALRDPFRADGTAQGRHQAIATTSFDLLAMIPGTRPTTELVRTVHNGTSDLVYAIVRATRKHGVGEVIRLAATGTNPLTSSGVTSRRSLDHIT